MNTQEEVHRRNACNIHYLFKLSLFDSLQGKRGQFNGDVLCVRVHVCVCDALLAKGDISRRVTLTNLICGLWAGHIE